MNIIKFLALTPLLMAMYGCGGSSGESTPTPVALSGVFIDAEVEGLSYTTDSGITGTTDENGTYTYLPGENVSFSVGAVSLGTVPGAPVCTPYDFEAASINIARFIQSLDADGDPSNGIDLVGANIALADTPVDSDAFIGDAVTFEDNTAIRDALATTGATLISEEEAIANLEAGTDVDFDTSELAGKLFVVIDPIETDIGIFSFDPITMGSDSDPEVISIFASDTTGAGGEGLETTETWVVSEGVLTLTDSDDGGVTTVNRVGGSSRSISVTYSQDGSAALPATLLIPEDLTAKKLGGDGVNVTSKTYDVIDTDGTPISITFNSDGTFVDTEATGTFEDEGTPGVVAIIDGEFPDEITFLIIIDGDITAVGETTSILLIGATIVGGLEPDLDIEFDEVGVGTATLTSVEQTP